MTAFVSPGDWPDRASASFNSDAETWLNDMNTFMEDMEDMFGGTNTISGSYAFCCGANNTVDAAYAAVLGGFQGQTRSFLGAVVTPGYNPGQKVQGSLHRLYAATTNATPARATADGNAAAANNVTVLPNNSAFHCRIRVIARSSSAATQKSWAGTCLIKRGANAAATAVIGSPSMTGDFGDAGLSTASIALAADTTLGALSVTLTGVAATTIRWSVEVENIEVLD